MTVCATTHGNVSGVAAYAMLPCGLVVRISNGCMTPEEREKFLQELDRRCGPVPARKPQLRASARHWLRRSDEVAGA